MPGARHLEDKAARTLRSIYPQRQLRALLFAMPGFLGLLRLFAANSYPSKKSTDKVSPCRSIHPRPPVLSVATLR